MVGLGTIVNMAAIIIGGTVGFFCHRLIPEKLGKTIMNAMALMVLFIGVRGAIIVTILAIDNKFDSQYTIIIIISMAIGTLIGELLDIEAAMHRFGAWVEKKFFRGNKIRPKPLGEAFVFASLLYCVGAMSITGAFQDGLQNDTSILFAKSVIDMVSSVIFAATMGPGIILSALSVGIYQGAFTALAAVLAPILSAEVINQVSAVGFILLIGIATNMLGITKIKVGNMIPAIFIPIIYSLVLRLF